MFNSIKIFLVSILAGCIFGILSLSNNQNTKRVSQAVESGVTMASSIAALVIILNSSPPNNPGDGNNSDSSIF